MFPRPDPVDPPAVVALCRASRDGLTPENLGVGVIDSGSRSRKAGVDSGVDSDLTDSGFPEKGVKLEKRAKICS